MQSVSTSCKAALVAGSDKYFPTTQEVQEEEATYAAKVPAGQITHDEAERFEYWPIAQLEQVAEAVDAT